MKPTLYLAMICLSLVSLHGTPLVDPEAWETATTPVQQLVQDDQLVLPAGTQLYRDLNAGNMTLRISSSPVFSSDPEQVAVLEFGTNSLVFIKENDFGRITLMSDDLVAQTLPPSVVLDENDRPTEALDLELTQRDGLLFLTIQKQTQQFPATRGATQIVLSAGASQDWTIRNLQVTFEPLLVGDDSEPIDGRTESSDGFSYDIGRSAATMGSADANMTSGVDGLDTSSEKPDSSEAKATQREVRLEVFTPPAVRRGRSAEVRAALNRANLK